MSIALSCVRALLTLDNGFMAGDHINNNFYVLSIILPARRVLIGDRRSWW